MSAFISRVKAALREVTPEWQWEFAFAPKAGEKRFKLVAKHDTSGAERVIYVTEKLFFEVPFNTIVHDIVRLLPTGKKLGFLSKDNGINVELQYESLREVYRERVEELQRRNERLPVQPEIASRNN